MKSKVFDLIEWKPHSFAIYASKLHLSIDGTHGGVFSHVFLQIFDSIVNQRTLISILMCVYGGGKQTKPYWMLNATSLTLANDNMPSFWVAATKKKQLTKHSLCEIIAEKNHFLFLSFVAWVN